MKIKSIAAICKKDKCITLYNQNSNNGEFVSQWLGNLGAMYSASGLPYLEKESIFTIFDVPEKNRNDYFFSAGEAPEHLYLGDTDPDEAPIEEGSLAINYAGRSLLPLQTTCDIVFIESRYLSPLSDVLDVVQLYERRTASGQVYIIAKAGFLIQAVIMPYDILNEAFINQIGDLTARCKAGFQHKETARVAAEGMPFDYTFEAGEALEETEVR